MVPISVIGRFMRSLGGALCIVAVLSGTPVHAGPDPLADTLAGLDADLRSLRDDVAKAAAQKDVPGLAEFGARAAAIERAVDLGPALHELGEGLRDENPGTPLRAIADAADRIGAAVEAARARAQLRGEAYGGADDPRYRQLVAQWGEAFADGATWAPTTVWDVFRPTTRPGDKSLDVALIWDEQGSEWYRIDGGIPVETVFMDGSVGLGRRLSAGKLKYLAENHDEIARWAVAADGFWHYAKGAAEDGQSPRGQAFARVAGEHAVLTRLSELEPFGLKFVYDASFRATVLDALDGLRRDLVKQGVPAEAALRDLDAMLAKSAITLESQWAEGVIPANATVRVTAWFSNSPRTRFVSTWRFEKEKVTVEIDKGYAQGIRAGNLVKSEGSIPGRNCTASDEREFKDGGNLSFTAIYVCTLADGSTQVNNVSGAGTWRIVPPPRRDDRDNSASGK